MMECTPEYANSWLCRRWPRWEAFCVERLGLTAAYLQKSVRAKKTAGEERVVSNTWAVATCAAVVIAARWADTLAKGPGENARRILADVVCQPFKEKTTLWAADWGGTGSPEPWQPSGAESVDGRRSGRERPGQGRASAGSFPRVEESRREGGSRLVRSLCVVAIGRFAHLLRVFQHGPEPQGCSKPCLLDRDVRGDERHDR